MRAIVYHGPGTKDWEEVAMPSLREDFMTTPSATWWILTFVTEVFGSAAGLAFLASSLRRRSIRVIDVRDADRLDPRLALVGELVPAGPVTCGPGSCSEPKPPTLRSRK